MGEMYNRVAAAMFRVEAAVRTCLTNPSSTNSGNECQPCRKDIKPAKIKDLSFDGEDFAERRKEKRPLIASPSKKHSTC